MTRVRNSALATRDVLRYLKQDTGSFLCVWREDTNDPETEREAKVFYQDKWYAVTLTISRSVREAKGIYWCGGGRGGAKTYRWKRKKKFPPISSSAQAQRENRKPIPKGAR